MLPLANNPFVRLKHYRPKECNPKENHATESLAACLRLSVPLRSAFIRLCHRNVLPFDESRICEAHVVTQEQLGTGILDLYISVPNHYHLGIEVKVAASEDVRHREQAVAYSNWLQKQDPPGRLISLVKIHDKQFDFRSCGIADRLTWRNVYDCFMAQAAGAQGGTDAELARALCGYLVNEGIVMDYDVRSLVQFAEGMKAQTALEATFAQVTDKLETHGFETNTRLKRDEWPRLEVKRKEWTAIFGEGQNYRIYVWFQVPGIWDATEHEFWPSIELYNQEYPSDWGRIQPRLESWFRVLREEKMKYEVYTKNWNECVPGLAAHRIVNAPVRITAYREQPAISQAEIVQLGPDDLIGSLVDEVRELSEIIERLQTPARLSGVRQTNQR